MRLLANLREETCHPSSTGEDRGAAGFAPRKTLKWEVFVVKINRGKKQMDSTTERIRLLPRGSYDQAEKERLIGKIRQAARVSNAPKEPRRCQK